MARSKERGAEQERGTRSKSRAKARARAATPTGVEEVPPRAKSPEFVDEDVGKTLCTKNGCLGFITNTGFQDATNFTVAIGAQVFCESRGLKGEILLSHIRGHS